MLPFQTVEKDILIAECSVNKVFPAENRGRNGFALGNIFVLRFDIV